VHCGSYAWRAPRCQMTFPAKPKTPYDYVSFQTGSPTDPLPANQIASDFVSHKTSIDALVDFSKLAQRSDGRLNNGSVRPETLSAGTVALSNESPRAGCILRKAFIVVVIRKLEAPNRTSGVRTSILAHHPPSTWEGAASLYPALRTVRRVLAAALNQIRRLF